MQLFDRVIKQAVVSEEEVFRIPGAEEPRAARAQHPSSQEGQGAPPPNELTEEEAAAQKRLAEALAAQKAAEKKAQELEELAQRTLKSANEQSAQILDAAREKAAALCEEARQQGYTEALNQTSEELRSCIDQVHALMEELSKRQQQYFEDYGEQLEDLAITVAEKLLFHTIGTDPAQMADLVMQAVQSVKTEDWVTVEISDQMSGLMERIQQQYAAYLSRRPVEFSQKELPKDACVVQTPSGITDASIATQLGNLRQMLHQKP